MTSGHRSSHTSSHTNSYRNSHSNSHTNSHTNHGNHANSVTTTGSLTPSTHSVSIGSTSITESSLLSYLSKKGSTAALSQLVTAANEARNSLDKPTSSSTITNPAKADNTSVQQVLTASGGQHIVYPYSSSGINMNITYNNNGTTGHCNSGALTNTKTAPITNKSIHCNVGSTNVHCNTAAWQTALYSKSFPDGSTSVTAGALATKNNLKSILAIINKGKVTSSSTSAGAWTASGDAKYTYSNSYSNSHSNSHTNSHSNSHSNSHTNSSTSSKKFKKDINELEMSALDLIKKINIVSFYYNEKTAEDPNIKHYGFIAENTPEEFATQYHDRMDYTNCIGLLLKAVQELSEKIS